MPGIVWGGASSGEWEGGKSWRIEFGGLDASGSRLAPCQSEYIDLLKDCLREARRSSEGSALSDLFFSGDPTHAIRLTIKWPDEDPQTLFACRLKLDGVFYGWDGEVIPPDQALVEFGRWFRSLLSDSRCGARANSQHVVPGDYAWKYWCQSVVILWLMLKALPNSSDD